MARRKAESSSEHTVPTTTPAAPTTLFSRVLRHLDEHEWNYSDDAESGVITAGVHLSAISARVRLIVIESDGWQRFVALTIFPVFVPEARRSAVARAIARINYETPFGAFEMDLGDGELRVKTAIESDSFISEGMISSSNFSQQPS